MQILPGYWFQHQPYPMLFLFRPNGTGVRTTYPTMGLPGGLPTHLTWTLNGDNLILTYATYQEALTLATFNASAAAIELTYPGYGEVVWYGCASGNMPSLIEQTVC